MGHLAWMQTFFGFSKLLSFSPLTDHDIFLSLIKLLLFINNKNNNNGHDDNNNNDDDDDDDDDDEIIFK